MLHCYSSGYLLCCRYFGSVEGSKFVEMASVDNVKRTYVKRTWVNYGGAREWSDPTQGQVGGGWRKGEREIDGSVRWVVIYLRSVHVLATKHLLILLVGENLCCVINCSEWQAKILTTPS